MSYIYLSMSKALLSILIIFKTVSRKLAIGTVGPFIMRHLFVNFKTIFIYKTRCSQHSLIQYLNVKSYFSILFGRWSLYNKAIRNGFIYTAYIFLAISICTCNEAPNTNDANLENDKHTSDSKNNNVTKHDVGNKNVGNKGTYKKDKTCTARKEAGFNIWQHIKHFAHKSSKFIHKGIKVLNNPAVQSIIETGLEMSPVKHPEEIIKKIKTSSAKLDTITKKADTIINKIENHIDPKHQKNTIEELHEKITETINTHKDISHKDIILTRKEYVQHAQNLDELIPQLQTLIAKIQIEVTPFIANTDSLKDSSTVEAVKKALKLSLEHLQNYKKVIQEYSKQHTKILHEPTTTPNHIKELEIQLNISLMAELLGNIDAFIENLNTNNTPIRNVLKNIKDELNIIVNETDEIIQTSEKKEGGYKNIRKKAKNNTITVLNSIKKQKKQEQEVEIRNKISIKELDEKEKKQKESIKKMTIELQEQTDKLKEIETEKDEKELEIKEKAEEKLKEKVEEEEEKGYGTNKYDRWRKRTVKDKVDSWEKRSNRDIHKEN